ncbi:thymidylate synthase ThyX [Streptomyces sp. V4I23]|uniref:FAD-dependent thymidylate synthase n=1 Tax=Streptomyces sp. V4I23 TaxID=3042282 RepID=UPI002787BF94|nr:FAD-dependent thymidylate synthase [Streptomyces sp. V4I23]MDQ1005855.1 thymidylate synthase ThyX [Streptomyces sp. V4I23]
MKTNPAKETSCCYRVQILRDSLSPSGNRLTTMEVTFPRFLLAQVNTHRVFSRNSASSRAIPTAKLLRQVLTSPYVPEEFGTNKPGMQAGPALGGEGQACARDEWLRARDRMVVQALRLVIGPAHVDHYVAVDAPDSETLLKFVELTEEQMRSGSMPDDFLGVHKQLANRLLEPFLWHTAIITATEWSNFFALRCHPDAQPEFQRIAKMMKAGYEQSVPSRCDWDQWHAPLVTEDEIHGDPYVQANLRKVSVARCARVSYLTHYGVRDPEADVRLHDRLAADGHLSPFEHVARPMTARESSARPRSGNFRGWHQYRKDIPHEGDFSQMVK